MVLHCQWGDCNGDERYPDSIKGKLLRFPNPKTKKDDAMAWIKACNRQHKDLNVSILEEKNKRRYRGVCSGHFVDGGPSDLHPYPIPFNGSSVYKARPSSKRRVENVDHQEAKRHCADVKEIMADVVEDAHCEEPVTAEPVTAEESRIDPAEYLAMAAELESAQKEIADQKTKIRALEEEIEQLKVAPKKKSVGMQTHPAAEEAFGVEKVQKETKKKNIFQFYTGLTYMRFMTLHSFLIPDGKFQYTENRKDIQHIEPHNGLFLTLCRLRQNFALLDLGTRFGISSQSAGIVFSSWLENLHVNLAQLSIWPDRGTILHNAPFACINEFPNTIVIIDATELKTQAPWSHCVQSQLYSDYKSSTTFKGLVGCDPAGSLIFVSELYTGSISDKALCQESGFFEHIKRLMTAGYIHDGDSVMADKGFTIHSELKDLGLSLNIPPFASSGAQMSPGDLRLTYKIARHRIHIERLISRIKDFKIIRDRIPTCLFKNLNQVWTVCCHLTNFQDFIIRKK